MVLVKLDKRENNDKKNQKNWENFSLRCIHRYALKTKKKAKVDKTSKKAKIHHSTLCF